MANGYTLAREQFQEIVEVSDGTIELLNESINETGSILTLEITLPFQGIEHVEGGLLIRARESFLIFVSRGFPYETPGVFTPHRRFAGFPHVQWGHSICLYQASSDWKPEDGMYGLISRLDGWVRDASIDNLDPDDAPLHPPVAYPTSSRLVVPIKDAPRPDDTPWIGFAVLREHERRTEIIDWKLSSTELTGSFAPAILLHEALSFFEYPTTVHALINEIERHGIQYSALIWHLAVLALKTNARTPFLVVLGTPMRRTDSGGPLLPHLEVWEIEAEAADQLRLLNAINLKAPSFKAIGKDALQKVVEWSVSAKVSWCRVREMRPAVTRRRDGGSPMEWFRNKTIEIWGCGAIGSHIAESIARAGVKQLVLTDDGTVVPGILVRQSFEDADIGKAKAQALGERIKRICPSIELTINVRDLKGRLDDDEPFPKVDLIIDCTASSTLHMKLERTLVHCQRRPVIASMGVSYDAQAGVSTLSLPTHSGGPFDVTRRLKLEACRKPTLRSLLDNFWPAEPRRERFQPEPGCSEPTFIGSDTDLAILSARMLNALAANLGANDGNHSASGWLFESQGTIHSFSWSPDTVLGEKGRGYSVRVSPEAMNGMRAWTRTSRRVSGVDVETGGLIFGELNEAAGVLWVSEVEGPPPDSDASEEHFTCGVAGMAEAAAEKQQRYRGSVSCVGSWHTHPNSRAEPSAVDISAVAQLLGAPDSTRRTFLLLILSGNLDSPTLGAHAFRVQLRIKEMLSVSFDTAATTSIQADTKPERNIGLALSGGGSRAIAFHLGCFRALHDLGLLDRLQVISSVSGGSILAAMYAYSNDSFLEFELRVVELLRRGLVRDIVRSFLTPCSLAKMTVSVIRTVPISLLRMGTRSLPQTLRSFVDFLDPAKPPPHRSYSRSEAFRDALVASLFGEKRCVDVERSALSVVINATELRTGSAFRFGSRESGCWRFGTIHNDHALVADAVAASAAYPVYLPALDREYEFQDRGKARVLLTDGGIFENLGVGPLEPGRTPDFSSNVFKPDYIIACDAGAGLLDYNSFPMWWPTRMIRSFSSTFRKVQDGTRKRLHQLASSGEIAGFVLSYLGQQDRALPWLPAGLPSRDSVYQYPTDFYPMAREDIKRISLRGEMLTRLLVFYYLPDLLE